jgi:hypothetical protein
VERSSSSPRSPKTSLTTVDIELFRSRAARGLRASPQPFVQAEQRSPVSMPFSI